MNQRIKWEFQIQFIKKCLECSSFYIGETGRKLKTRLHEQKQDANKEDESKIFGLDGKTQK